MSCGASAGLEPHPHPPPPGSLVGWGPRGRGCACSLARRQGRLVLADVGLSSICVNSYCWDLSCGRSAGTLQGPAPGSPWPIPGPWCLQGDPSEGVRPPPRAQAVLAGVCVPGGGCPSPRPLRGSQSLLGGWEQGTGLRLGPGATAHWHLPCLQVPGAEPPAPGPRGREGPARLPALAGPGLPLHRGRALPGDGQQARQDAWPAQP